jgi:hypothetical protein
MKCNAHLYLPWSVIADLAASTGAQLGKVKSDRPRVPVASTESLDGGCVLYRPAAFARFQEEEERQSRRPAAE